MKEALFLKRNKERWLSYEKVLHGIEQASADVLSQMYIALTDDLAYAQTYYPKSKSTRYLNHLTAQIHQYIYRNKKEKKGRFASFWLKELPLIFREAQPYFFIAFLIFTVALGIGALSAAYDERFVRLIMGDAYVDMTLENIRKGNTMAVYGQSDELSMFLSITLNNIWVSFRAFAWGGVFGDMPLFMFLSFGTGYILLYNGIMLGSFFYFLYAQGVLWEASGVIWLHGTIEISVIILAGGAGILMGNGVLFPGTYSRLLSFTRAARQGVQIIIGLVPFFVLAGFIESFITRYTQMPLVLKLLIIGLSFSLVVFYFVIYPHILYQKFENGEIKD